MRALPAVVMALCLVLITGCGVTNPKAGSQTIAAHKIAEKWEKASKVCFTAAKPKQVPGRSFCVVMSNEILEKKVPIASVYWHGDGAGSRLERTNPFSRRGIFGEARRVVADGPVIAVIRPHSNSKYDWRQMSEIELQRVLLEYLSRTFGVEKFNLYGHSGGGLVAIAVAQERPELTATVGLASPKLAVLKHYMRHENGVPSRYSQQYDPIKHIQKLSSKIPVLIIYDTLDKTVKPGGVLPYVEKAKKLGLKVKMILVKTNDYHHHVTQWHLGKHLRKEENREFRTVR